MRPMNRSPGARDPQLGRTVRASRAEVRNPVLGLPAVRRLAAFRPEVLDALAELLLEIHEEAAVKAEHCWRARKGPMAVYWRAVSVYSGHIRRAIRRLRATDAEQLPLLSTAA